MKNGRWVGFAVGALVLVACAEANDGADGGLENPHDGEDATPGSPEAGTSHDATSTMNVDAGNATATDGSAASGLVINEVNGEGNDYVELLNVGSATFDLAGFGVTEAKNDEAGVSGTPKTPAVFAAGSALAPNGYAVVLGAPKEGGAPLACPTNAVCLQATWNISHTNGATVTLLNPSDASVEVADFPAGATGSGQSWGRLPNGTGTLQINKQTPGLPNAGP
jgi:hypothetical protein